MSSGPFSSPPTSPRHFHPQGPRNSNSAINPSYSTNSIAQQLPPVPSTSRSSSSGEMAGPTASGSGYFAGNGGGLNGTGNRRPGSQSSGSGSSGHASGSGASGEQSMMLPSNANNNLLAPGQRSSSYMGGLGNTVGLDMTSAAIARGEVGANYSRYSTGNISAMGSPPLGSHPGLQSPPLGSNNRLSMASTPAGLNHRDSQIELDSMPVLYAGGAHAQNIPPGASLNPNSPSGTPLGKSRFSEYGLDNASSESPSYRSSTLFDSNGARDSMQYYQTKAMEDTSLLWNEKNIEADDFLHDPRTLNTARSDRFWNFPTSPRGLANAVGISVILGGLLALFMGWPIHTYVTGVGSADYGAAWNMGTNSSGQVPDIPNLPSLIDSDTPADIRDTIMTGYNGRQYQLVFSDEFNVDGRTFFPGDDPYWEAVDIHYWQTRDLEWYDPDAVTTKDGKLEITLSEQPIHGLSFRSGMLQTWNKLCFNGGAHIEISVSLPGNSKASGMWPGLWTMGNLGRAGYGATNDGMWPYSYDSCDVGTLEHQMYANDTPAAAMDSGETDYSGQLSILVGQRASACTCQGEPHPGPDRSVGRGAPEIDILEAQVDWRGYGTASQSIQIAPFDYRWNWNNRTTDGMEIYNNSRTTLNSWKGAATQESASAVTILDSVSYGGAQYQTFGYEFVPGGDTDSQITWSVGGVPTWTLKAGAFTPDSQTLVGQRLISEEPMYLIMNLAISAAFQSLQFDKLEFPGVFLIDYVRVWQEKGKTDITCDPESHPTADYINTYAEYYTNPNITTWPDDLWPKNSLIDNCT